MKRLGIIETIGKGFLTENIEGGEFSYIQALGKKVTGHFKIDLRFYSEEAHVAVLVETKTIYKNKDVKQLFSYVELEQELDCKTKIIAILANTENNMFKIWKIENDECSELDDRKIKSMEEYITYFKKQNSNDKTAVLENTSKLNRILHDNGIPEKLRSQFVGTCLLALKNGLVYKDLETDQIISGIKNKLGKLLQESMDKAKKLSVLQTKVLESQNVEAIEGKNFEKILTFIEQSILPYINESSFEGQDILSYFFTTFNKYVAREDKNQAFTPNHICHFMSKVAGIDRKTRVLDPTCGSGTFLVQAMTMELAQCETEKERFDVKSEQIYGIEFDESVFGLSTTNMLIHGDGNSNIRCGSCFENDKWIEHASIDVVLMNPPYNASKSQMPKTFAPKFGKSTTDPSKGLYFVNHILKCVKGQKGRLLALLPMSCAITTKGVILELKKEILENNTLDAVFSFPDEMFYPGASAVACCMVFNVGKPHPKDYETFFGYFKNDGFEKRKGVGRVDVRNKWENIEKEWLDLYHHRNSLPGKSVTKHVSDEDEWCAEAYMETDYSILCENDFIQKMRSYASYLVACSQPNKLFEFTNKPILQKKTTLNTNGWKWFTLDDGSESSLFKIDAGKYHYPSEYSEGETPYLSATAINNGVGCYIDLEPEFEGNVMTTEKVHCTSFYQKNDFCATSDVNIIKCKKKVLNVYVGMFIISIIDFNENFRWNYGRQCRVNDTKSIRVKLPAVKTAPNKYEPDWQFMEDYIKSLPYSSCL